MTLLMSGIVGVMVGWWLMRVLRGRRQREQPISPQWLNENAYRERHDRRRQ